MSPLGFRNPLDSSTERFLNATRRLLLRYRSRPLSPLLTVERKCSALRANPPGFLRQRRKRHRGPSHPGPRGRLPLRVLRHTVSDGRLARNAFERLDLHRVLSAFTKPTRGLRPLRGRFFRVGPGREAATRPAPTVANRAERAAAATPFLPLRAWPAWSRLWAVALRLPTASTVPCSVN